MKNISTYKIVSTGIILLIIFLLYSFGKEFKEAASRWLGNEEEEEVDYDDTPIPDDETVTPGFDARPYVARLIEVMSFAWDSSPRCAAYERLLSLSNADFITVINAYKNNTGRTLRSDMDANLYDGCNVFYNRYGVQVRDRMDALRIIG